ncbi:protein-tyrosine-phosphatase [Roseomonas gilardii]|uniref:Protein-tyrosine-phosphatase n=1 Tax=Roseomonas gilardii TaxID=257708 RepID=A0A1L7AI47_9PROT|nr:protein-tyrosine-phosphatase [Roseomonas gilardii]APT58369.1 protein-tyrosine-phosphatase [Roseomonas gilardii]
MDPIAPFGIGICGIEELDGHCEAGVSHVLSILDPEWPVPESFGRFGEHRKLELRFHDVIEETPGMIRPEQEHVEQILAFGADLVAEPEGRLLVHCHAGISRSTAAMALILAQARPDLAAEAIYAEILRIRPKAWPNLRIVEWGDALLRRSGTMIGGAASLYRRQLVAFPRVRTLMAEGGRAREVAAADAAT